MMIKKSAMVTFSFGFFETELSFINKKQFFQTWGKESHLKLSQQMVGLNCFCLEKSRAFLLLIGFLLNGENSFSQKLHPELMAAS